MPINLIEDRTTVVYTYPNTTSPTCGSGTAADTSSAAFSGTALDGEWTSRGWDNAAAMTAGTYADNGWSSSEVLVYWQPAEIVRTPEQMETDRRAAAERAAQEARAQEVWEAAEKAALELLLAHLTQEQRQDYKRFRYFIVLSKDHQRCYRIKHGSSGNIEWINEQGIAIGRFCVHIKKRVPLADNMLAQKLFLESDDIAFLEQANVVAGQRPLRQAA